MKWLELKQDIEKRGVKDDDDINVKIFQRPISMSIEEGKSEYELVLQITRKFSF